MAASAVSICNAALVLLGADRIISLTEDSREAKVCNELYEPARDEVLEVYPWACTLKRASLPRTTGLPLFGFEFQYALPTDCLRVLEMQEQDTYSWREVAGRLIETDAGTCKVQYISQVSDVPKLPPLLRSVISSKLMMYLAYALPGTASMFEVARDRYMQALSDAVAADAARQSVQLPPNDTFLDARS